MQPMGLLKVWLASGLVSGKASWREGSTIMNHYSEEFRADTVSLVESGTPQNKVCRDLGVSKSALSGG